jgi:hypothetical protein
MNVQRLTPPRSALHVSLGCFVLWAGLGVMLLAAALDPGIRSWTLGAVGIFVVGIAAWGAWRNYRVRVDLGQDTIHIHGWFWSRRVARDRITAVWDPGHIQFSDAHGHPKSVWVTWLLRDGPDDATTVLGRAGRPMREATAAIREWSGVSNAL